MGGAYLRGAFTCGGLQAEKYGICILRLCCKGPYICNGNFRYFLGIPAYSSMDNATTLQYISMSQTLVGLSRGLVRDVDPQNDLVILRIRTRKSEIIVAPEKSSKDKDSYLIVIQNEEK